MAVSTDAFFLFPQGYVSSAGDILNEYGSQIAPEGSPSVIWGQGTPGTIDPFTTVNKGSLYMEVNAPDNDPNVWQKVADAGVAADYVRFGNTGIVMVVSTLYDVSAANSEQVIYNAVTACEVLEAGLLWEEASGTVAAGDITIGTASGGGQIVAATAYTDSTSSGDYQALTIGTAALAAGDSVFASHDTVAAAGTHRVLMKIRVEA